MEVKIINSEINPQELLLKVSQCGKGSVSLFVGTRKDISEKSVLGSVTGGTCYEILQSYLVEVCREVSKRLNVIFIAIHSSLIESFDVPCLAICCLAATYQIAAEAVNNAVDLINGRKAEFLCDDSDESLLDVVSSDLIQIKANSRDINHRISSFIERRRAQVDADNIRDFCCPKHSSDEISCARVDAVKILRKDSSSHLRVRKVFNSWGPQTISRVSENNQCLLGSIQKMEMNHDVFKTGNKDIQTNSSKDKVNKKIMFDERLKNVEEHVGSNSDSHGDVCIRLKRIEDKILFLEGLSPEYFNLGSNKSNEIALSSTPKNARKRTYSAAELSSKIKELEGNLVE